MKSKTATATRSDGQEQSETYVDGLGRKAGTVYYQRGRRRIVTAPITIADDGTVTHGTEAVAAFAADLDEVHEHNRQALAQLKPHELARLETWLRTRTQTTPPARPHSRPSTGRAPREARNYRPRGSRRGERSTSSSSDDPGPDSEPAERRLCENKRCQADISHLGPGAYHCDNGGACKQQAYRDRTIELLYEIEGTIAEGLSCVCEPKHNVTENQHCLKCGFPRGVVTRGWEKDPAPAARSFVVTRGLPLRELRVRPDRELSAKLRKTRGRWDKPARREEVAA